MNFDVVVVGCGAVGLAFTAALANSDLRIALIEKQSTASLAEPGFDGREIAITQRSIEILRSLEVWGRLPIEVMSRLVEARVENHDSPYALTFNLEGRPEAELGVLIPHCRIRAATFQVATKSSNVYLFSGVTVVAAGATPSVSWVQLADGQKLTAPLVIAADSRLSRMRDYWGIQANVSKPPVSVLVCRFAHALEHHHIATERFELNGIVATLPLVGRQSSVVLTLPTQHVARLLTLDDTRFAHEVSILCRHRLGEMCPVSGRHHYPLVTSYARRFVSTRAALIGDAAVGINPMTAHGFNLGLRGASRLAASIKDALSQGHDIGSKHVLARYEREHQKAAFPLFTSTEMIWRLYTNRSVVGRAARHAGLRIADRVAPFKNAVRTMLMETDT